MTYKITSGLKNKNILNTLSRHSPVISGLFVRGISDNSLNNVDTPSSGIEQIIQETHESGTTTIINNITPESVPTNLFDKIPGSTMIIINQHFFLFLVLLLLSIYLYEY